MNISAVHRPPGTAYRPPVNRSDDMRFDGTDLYSDTWHASSNAPRTLTEIKASQPGPDASWAEFFRWIFNLQ